MDNYNEQNIISKLINFTSCFPLPEFYKSVLQDQISKSSIFVEQHHNCFKILFSKNEDAAMFPQWQPTLLQGCQILKDNGPISCQLFVENGRVVQFEVVDMGLNEIDWDYFWTHKAIYDVEYDFKIIKQTLESDKIFITNFGVIDENIFLNIKTNTDNYTLNLYNSTIRRCLITQNTLSNKLQLFIKKKAEHRYSLVSDDKKIELVCSLVAMQ